ncbi:Lipase 1 [Grifola frondosa]|uniref:Lipase 1 n=1 Tax=Grifola frondosa TaxID=5627 RepID=A0A1C7M344_GRIFR|nr:Lipase 1 [Grifola frondosa]
MITVMHLSITLLALSFCSFSLAATPHIQLGKTTLVGKENIIPGRGSQEFFGGIPYAEPPVGTLRFAPPVLKYNLDVPIFNVTSYGNICPQSSPFDGPPSIMHEDCLTLNIFRPSGVHIGSGVPVMIWIYSLSWSTMNPGGVLAKYDPTPLVLQSMDRGTPVIFVSLNYRLGPFGFPLGYEASARGALNLGLKDQLTAFEWVQRNIAWFGGDPQKVTIFGEGSGATAISMFYLNKEVERYARAAIVESGSAGSIAIFDGAGPENEFAWQAFVNATPECAHASPNNTFDCLREANVTTLVNSFTAAEVAADPLLFSPAIDGPGGLIPELPSKTIRAGHFSHIPFIAGTNLDEGVHSIHSWTDILTDEQVREFIAPILLNANISLPQPDAVTETLDELLKLYPNIPALGSPFNTGNATFGKNPECKRVAAICGDWLFQALRRQWTHATSRAGVKTFGYLFSDPQAPDEDPYSWVNPGGTACAFLVPRLPTDEIGDEAEVSYVFGVPAFNRTPVPANILSLAMMDYWISFAVSLDPNDGRGSQRPHWPQYTPENEILLQLQGGNTTVIPDDYRSEQLRFITDVIGQFHR